MPNQLSSRHQQNCTAYILIYAIIGVMCGLIFDAMITYLMAVAPDTAKSMASYMGLATLAASCIAILAPKVGFKRIMTFAAAVIAASLVLISYAQKQWLISAGLLLVITGTTLFDVMLSPFIAAYTTQSNRSAFFTKASFASTLGVILGTSIGGPLIVWIFAHKLNLSYHTAMLLTKSLGSLNLEQHSYYIGAHRTILLLFAVISLLMVIPCIKIKELPEDHQVEADTKVDNVKSYSVLTNKYIILFLLFTVLTRFSGSLIVPQLSAYLTNVGINRVTVSILGTVQYFSILGFMAFSTIIVRKIGQVYAIAALYLASVPFMLILANGYSYSSSIELIIGTALFFRAGLVNAATPVINALTMDLVSKQHRSLYSSIIFVMQSFSQILAGMFAKYFLFSHSNGYAYAYYYATGLYFMAIAILAVFFTKKYNRSRTVDGAVPVSKELSI